MTQVLDTKEIWNLDEHRHEIELMHADDYLRSGYYGRWLFAMERLLDRKNIVRREEVQQRVDEILSQVKPTALAQTSREWPRREDQKVRWGPGDMRKS